MNHFSRAPVPAQIKVLIAAASWASNISGIQRHALNLTRCLLQRPEITELHLVVAPWQKDLVQTGGIPEDSRVSVHIAEMQMGTLSRNLWHYRELPRLAARLNVDVVHLSYPVPVVAASFHCPTVVTLHDLYPYEIPENFGFPKYIFNRAMLQHCLRGVNSIACVSDTTLRTLRCYVPEIIWRKSVRIYNCVESYPHCVAQSPIPGWQLEPFFLAVAQHRPNKNLPLLVQTFHSLICSGRIDPRTKLVIVGIQAAQTGKIQQCVASSGLHQNVHFLEGLPEPDLQWCYRHCAAFVAPSITEGFGLSVAEALLAGCRVVCSDIPAHREIAEDHCMFVELRGNVEQQLAEAILTALDQPQKQPVALPHFSASVLVGQYVDLYQRLLASRVPDAVSNSPISVEIPDAKSQML
ncbi:glycosyltransferase family 4 protein [Acidicapsa dinghuensis]|uniref:Glycosyltransferase family 4 protein n=1 Tax=Acidicapsa dinghuensis TaxID=2218256 RepID=A0ABW1EEW5_9BACT|nr:glycosyltransferase family 1 protein [Acidicapsa dinghuensis]